MIFRPSILTTLGVKESFKNNEKVYVILEKSAEGVFGAKSVSRDTSGRRKIHSGTCPARDEVIQMGSYVKR